MNALDGFACIVRGHAWIPRHSNRDGYYQTCFHCGQRRYARHRNVA